MGAIGLLVTVLVGGCGAGGREPAPAAAEAGVGSAALGEGFLVWESNRSGEWRLWTRRLDGSGLAQLTRDEPGMQHCCPHIAPDGKSLVYLSRAVPRDRYTEQPVAGPLRLLDLASGTERELVAAARTYGWGNRAAVWRGSEALVYVGEDGRTHLLEVASGSSRPLTDEPREQLGWLIDPTLSWAVHADPEWGRYDAARRRVVPQQAFKGCEGYFSPDGKWGYWIAGGGGPLQRLDLASGEVSTILEREDRRLPGPQRYLYFPMLSRDGSLLAFGASDGAHNHFTSDYDVWAVPVDPEGLEVSGEPVRLTAHPATDRYPDVFRERLPLGRHRGEAPLAVRFPVELPGGAWRWDYGDGAAGEAAAHLYERPGTFRVTARRGERVLVGQVVVDPARPPRVTAAELQGSGETVVVTFDEPIQLVAPRFALASGVPVTAHRLESGGRRLVLALGGRLAGGDTLELAGVLDRAGRPQPLAETRVAVAPPAWPADREGLVFLWQTGEAPNQVWDAELGSERTFPVEVHGRARLDHDFAMRLAGGVAVADKEVADRLLDAVRARHELALEVRLMAAEAPARPATVLALTARPGVRDLAVEQRGEELVAVVRTATGEAAVPLFAVAPGAPVHLALVLARDRLAVFRDGRPAGEHPVTPAWEAWQGGRLRLGDRRGGGGDWGGTLEGLAIWGRALAPGEVAEDAARYAALVAARPEVAQRRVRARLVAVSDVPTLADISPYTQALAVFDYEAAGGDLPAGQGLRVARWVMLGGETLPVSSAAPGQVHELLLEPFAANRQLESVVLSDTLPRDYAAELWFAVE